MVPFTADMLYGTLKKIGPQNQEFCDVWINFLKMFDSTRDRAEYLLLEPKRYLMSNLTRNERFQMIK